MHWQMYGCRGGAGFPPPTVGSSDLVVLVTLVVRCANETASNGMTHSSMTHQDSRARTNHFPGILQGDPRRRDHVLQQCMKVKARSDAGFWRDGLNGELMTQQILADRMEVPSLPTARCFHHEGKTIYIACFGRILYILVFAQGEFYFSHWLVWESTGHNGPLKHIQMLSGTDTAMTSGR